MVRLVEEGTGASGRLRKFFRLPVFADEEQTQKAQALHFVIWSILLVINSQFYVALFILPRQWARWVAILLTIDFTLPLLLLLNRRRGARARDVARTWLGARGACQVVASPNRKAVSGRHARGDVCRPRRPVGGSLPPL